MSAIIDLYRALPIPVDGALGDIFSLADILAAEFGPDLGGYGAYTVAYQGTNYLTQNGLSYWTPNDQQVSWWSLNGGDIRPGLDHLDANTTSDVTPESLARAEYHVGNNIGPFAFIQVPVAYDANGIASHYVVYCVTSIDPMLESATLLSGRPNPADIVASAYRFAAAYSGVPNTEDCGYIADAVAAAAGATLSPGLSGNDDPLQNGSSGFWRVAYRGTDAGFPANWSTLVQPGDIVRIGSWASGPAAVDTTPSLSWRQRQRATTTSSPFSITASWTRRTGSRSSGYIRIVLQNGQLYDEAANPASVTIFRLSPDHLYMINGSDLGDHLSGTRFDDTITGGANDDTITGWLGNDIIDGRGGADTMIGGQGNDTYYVDNSSDNVVRVLLHSAPRPPDGRSVRRHHHRLGKPHARAKC